MKIDSLCLKLSPLSSPTTTLLTAVLTLFLLCSCDNGGAHMPLPAGTPRQPSGSAAPASSGASGQQAGDAASADQPDSDGDQTAPPPETGPTFLSEAREIFENRCSACHTGDPLPNWTEYSMAAPNADNIVFRITLPEDDPQHMPPGNMTDMTEDERNTLIEWVEAGVPWGNETIQE